MSDAAALEPQVQALEQGHAFVDRSAFRKTLVAGPGAPDWLHDLVTGSVSGLAAGQAARSLLLTPTGRIRADVHVSRTEDGFVLLQDPEQPHPIGELLEPYVLSADVTLEDRTEAMALFSIPDPAADAVGRAGSRPSLLGTGMDLLAPTEDAWKIETMLVKKNLTETSGAAVEIWRIRRGVPRFPVDVGEDSVPAEAGLEETIDFTKGCFLGQESVAKIRNLGHPPRLVVALRAEGVVAPGDHVMAAKEAAGEVTSAAPDAGAGRTALLARVRWEARHAPLALLDGRALLRE